MTYPQNKRLIENKRVPGISMTAMIIWVKVDVNIMDDHRSKKKNCAFCDSANGLCVTIQPNGIVPCEVHKERHDGI